MDKTKAVKIIDIVILVLIFSMLFVNVLQIVGHNKGVFLISAIINVQRNWQTLTMENLRPTRSHVFNYTLSFATFYGYEKCCQCPKNESPNEFNFFLGICSRDNIASGCKLIPSEGQKKVDMWEEHYSFYKLVNYSYFDYLENHSVSKDEQCPDGTQRCGILDTLGHVLCMPEALCPVNNFTIDPIYSSFGKGENVPDRHLIVELNLTDEYPPCLNHEEMNSFNYQKCKIERKNFIEGCKTSIQVKDQNITVDERVVPLFTINKADFYEKCAFNTIMKDCIRGEDNYTNMNMTLYIRNYFGISKKCLKHYSNETVAALQMPSVSKSYNSSISSYMIYLAFSIFNSVLIIAHWIISLMKNQSLINKLENQIWSLILLFGFFSSFIIMTFLFETKFFFSLYHEEGCFDDINEYIFKNAQTILQSWKYKDLFLFLSGLIVGITCIIRERLTKDQTFVEYVEYKKPEELEDLEGEEGFTDDSFAVNN